MQGEQARRADAVNGYADARAKNLVPSIDLDSEPSGAAKART
jgi:hypothetical protein